MATARAIANGNWSAASTWNGGVLPSNGDTVYANSYTVTIDQNVLIGDTNNPSVNAGSFVAGQYYIITFTGTTSFIGIGASSNSIGTTFLCTGAGSGTGIAKAIATLTTLSNTTAGATTGGGGFVMPTAYNANVDLRPSQTLVAPCLTITATTGTVNMIGSNIIPGGGVGNSNGLVNSSSATVSLSGYYISASAYSYGVVNYGSGTINVNSCTLVSAGGGINTSVPIINSSTGTIIITNSSITGSGQGSGVNNAGLGSVTITLSNITSAGALAGVTNSSLGTITITSSTLTAGSGPAITNSSTGAITCSACTYTASAAASAVTGSGTIRLSGTFVSATNGQQAISSSKWILNTAPTASYIQQALDGINAASYVRFYTSDNNPNGGVATTDVRLGVSYGGGLVGTCAVPNAGTVAFGVAVDNTTGTATLTAANVRAALGMASANMDTQLAVLSNLDATVSSRLAPSGTLATVTTLTNAPTVPTAAAIASQVRTELATELARVDVATSTRLATSGYTAPSAAPTVAAIRAEMDSNSTKLANLDATVSSRLATSGYTAPSAAPTVAAIRTEMDSNSTKLANLDATVSSRLASSAYTAPSNSDVAAIKAKTDLLNTDRLAQASTVATTGAQIAAALS